VYKIDEEDTITEQEKEEDHENERQKKTSKNKKRKVPRFLLNSGYYVDDVTRSIIRYLNNDRILGCFFFIIIMTMVLVED
jgi:SOS response regulatory protein OraA/RecX